MELFPLREPVSAWSHCAWLLLSFPGGLLLWRQARGVRSRQVSLLIFALSLSFCYASSTLYHAVRLSGVWLERFDRLDHAGIYLLIAGSYTPLAWNMLRGRLKWAILSSVWSLATAGALRVTLLGSLPRAVETAFYLGLGWGAIFCYFEVARILSHREVFPVLLGGVLYSVGAVFNLAHWPTLWPGVFGPHELFHLFVMGGSFCHFAFMLRNVAPFLPGDFPDPARVPAREGD